jgi:putative nucleotidyltransferase with HDIG domain
MIATKRSDPLSPSAVGLPIVIVCLAAVAGIAELLLGSFEPLSTVAARVARGVGVGVALLALHIGARESMGLRGARASKSFAAVYLLSAGSVLVVSLVKLIALALLQYGNAHWMRSDVFEGALAFTLPYTVGVLVAQSTLGLSFGVLAGLVAAVVYGSYASNALLTLGMILTSGVVASVAFRSVRSRASYIRASIRIAYAMAPFALLSLVLQPPTSAFDVAVRVLGCFVSGFVSSIAALMATPIVEYVGGYASDLRLIEMATLDHPLLKELSVQAPGTWNHSMVIGMMVESAADAIGANPVVCRVGAYFHDIGKSKKPLYFVENQAPGDNRHDKLSPSMSALIIRAHVKDGIDLVRRYNLPRVIEEMIPQHHGTSMIDFFYDKARKEAEELGQDPDSVDRALYQYPGPKPQTREAGLLMLADGIEAAARTLSEPTQDRIQGLVQKMLNKVFASGELNECDLTLQDLHVIAKCFTRVLTGIYHQRIAYAEPSEKVSVGHEPRDGGRSEDGSERPRGNLRRLGIE